MAIVLQSTGGGSVSIQEPTTAINFTQTLPAATGTVMVSGNMPAFSAYQSSAQTLSSATNTKIQFQTKEFDTASAFDNATNYRFTPLVAGYYQISGGFKSGAGNPNATTSNQWQVSALVYFNGSTDYVELYGYVSTGQALVANAQYTYFQGVLVRTA
jgi:hypothetical protein